VDDKLVTDTACDANDVYVELRLYIPGGHEDVGRFGFSGGCRAGGVDGLAHDYTGSDRVGSARVYACVNDAGPDTCYAGKLFLNPHNP
jgi:hypothetical protein